MIREKATFTDRFLLERFQEFEEIRAEIESLTAEASEVFRMSNNWRVEFKLLFNRPKYDILVQCA